MELKTSLILIFFTFILSFIFSKKLTRKIINITKKFNLSFYTDERRNLNKSKSRLGGVGILTSQIFSFLISLIFLNQFYTFEVLPIIAIVSTVFAFSLIGILDDLFSLSPFYRLILQFLIVIAAWNGGIRLEFINSEFYLFDQILIFDSPFLNILLSSLWIVGLTNSINWLDGLDGLASSFSANVFFIFGLIFMHLNNPSMGLLCFSALGSCLGFLKYNFFPSKIFMGDGGSYFLGSLLSILTIFLNININNYDTNQFKTIIPIITFIIFCVPIADMVIVIFSRLRKKISPFYPDKSHFHHKLKKVGLSVNDIVILNLSFTQWLGFSILYFLKLNQIYNTIWLISFFGFTIIIIYYALKIKKFSH